MLSKILLLQVAVAVVLHAASASSSTVVQSYHRKRQATAKLNDGIRSLRLQGSIEIPEEGDEFTGSLYLQVDEAPSEISFNRNLEDETWPPTVTYFPTAGEEDSVEFTEAPTKTFPPTATYAPTKGEGKPVPVPVPENSLERRRRQANLP